MHLFEAIVAFTSLIAHVSPKTIQVNVGQHGLSYDPDYIEANTGDKIQFNFYHNHTVVQSNFSSPCLPLAGGFYSGFIPSDPNNGAASAKFILTINNSQPLYFYCSLYTHCQGGMVGGINPPNAQTLAQFAANAESSAMDLLDGPPPAAVGGVISAITGSSSSTEASLHPSQISTTNTTSQSTFVPHSTTALSAESSHSGSSSSSATPSTATSSTVASTSTAIIVTTTPPSRSAGAATSTSSPSSTSTTATATGKNAAVCWDSGKGLEVAFGVFIGVVLIMMW